MAALTAPQFQIENVGWGTEDPDYRPRCTRCTWSWELTDDDDALGSRTAAARFAHAVHRVCRPERRQQPAAA